MLRIEKLFLQGFKSFCDPTEVILDEEGITAVVGPNGCGKSNIADAISWVIGEQRAKALRGGKMEDVIFQGSRNRQPSGLAEVILTMVVHETFEIRGEANQPETEALRQAEESLQQADAAIEASTATTPEGGPEGPAPAPPLQTPQEAPLQTVVAGAGPDSAGAEAAGESAPEPPPVEGQSHQAHQLKKRRKHVSPGATRVFHEGERITVGRRLYRTGESEYEMNGRICRLRDVQDLFAGTGLGGAHYAIIEQGRIGQVLSAKPLDRRALIEEAAGISKFKMRQHAAELKLEAAKNNLSRITDILTEIERQQNSLKRQAARARRYQRLKQEMRELMRAVYVADYRTTSAAVTDLESALSRIAARESEISSSLAGLEESQVEATQVARSAEESLNQTRQVAANIDLDTERARQQHSHLSEQLQSLGVRSAQFAQDQSSISERRRFIEQESSRLRDELQKLEQEIDSESRILADAENDHQAQLARDAESELRLEEARKRVYESVTHLERWRQLVRQFTDSVERGQSRLQGLSAERERAMTQAQATQEEYAKLTQTLEETSRRQQDVGLELSDLAVKLAELRRSREEGQERLANLQRDLTATEHRLKSLSELDRGRAYFSEAVQALLMRDPQANGFKTLGTLADFVQVSSEHEAMIETALRDELQYVVVPTFDDALGAIEFLKQEGAGRATFLVIGLHGAQPYEPAPNGDGQNGHRTLASLLGLRSEFADAFKLALPGLATARIVADTGQAISASLSDHGAAGNGSGRPFTTVSITGERVVAGRLISGGSSTEKGIGVLSLKREIGELTDRLDSLAFATGASEGDLNQVKDRIARQEDRQKGLDGELRQTDKRLAVLREQFQQCERERERTSAHIRIVEQETAQAEEELKEFETRLEHASAQTEAAERSRAEAEKVVEVAQAEMAELRRNAEQRSEELSRRRAEFAAKTERRRGSQNDVRRLASETSDLDYRLGRLRLETIEADDQARTTQSTIHTMTEQLQNLTAQQQAHAAELELRATALAAAREKLETIELELRAARDAATHAREERAQREIEKARLTSDLEHLINSCHTELGENIVEICERLDRSREAAARRDGTTDSIDAGELAPAQTSDEQAAPLSQARPTPEFLDPDESEPAGEIDDDVEISFWTAPEDFDLLTAKARLDELRAKIDGLGPVNMMALDELTEVEERFDFLTLQKDDIERAIADTQSAIAEIKRRSRERFHEAFHAINENFKLVFRELFGGGHGEMRLIDESDILESGIEIIAQPPGKRLQNILLLSGGEKAMAALSLVLAIFKYRPSPFCLLDEVDAPLDEVNIGRFADKVIELSANTQFMIITHSKRTMEAAKTLYGVTMEDPGISKLISVRLT
jgi:chromosome segregation protein